jgi:hypothetical protein
LTQVFRPIADKQMADELMACEAGKSRAEKIFEKVLKFFQRPPIQQLQIEFIGMLPSKNPREDRDHVKCNQYEHHVPSSAECTEHEQPIHANRHAAPFYWPAHQ